MTGPSAPRVVDCPSGNTYKVSVTGLAFYVIWHEKHSADWLAALASPYPASPDFPLFRGQNKTPRNTLFINGSTVSTGYCATVEVLHRTSKWGEVRRLACPLRRFPFAAPPNCGGKVVAPATKGGMHFLERSEVGLFSSGEARLSSFRHQRRHKKMAPERAPTSPAQRYYITPEGESPQPACKAKPITGRTLAAQGRKARRLAQPSRP